MSVSITFPQKLTQSTGVPGTVQLHTMAPDGLAAARAVDMLRSRTGLIPAHAAQLLVLADGSIEAALALYTLEPTMFDVSQHSLLCHPSLRSDAVELPSAACVPQAPAPGVIAPRSSRADAAPAVAAALVPAPHQTTAAALRDSAHQFPPLSFAAAPAASPMVTPTDAHASSAVPASLPSHSRSPFAKARRNKLKKERKQLQVLHAASPSDGRLPAPQVAAGHHARLARVEAVGFARGAAAEKAAAKERRGRRRIEKKAKKAGQQAGKRQARRRRVGQA